MSNAINKTKEGNMMNGLQEILKKYNTDKRLIFVEFGADCASIRIADLSNEEIPQIDHVYHYQYDMLDELDALLDVDRMIAAAIKYFESGQNNKEGKE